MENKIGEFNPFLNPGNQKGEEGVNKELGDRNLFMAMSISLNDCIVGNNCILANAATLAGHVELGDGVVNWWLLKPCASTFW